MCAGHHPQKTYLGSRRQQTRPNIGPADVRREQLGVGPKRDRDTSFLEKIFGGPTPPAPQFR